MAVYGTDLRTGIARNGAVSFTGWTVTLGLGQPQLGGGATGGQVLSNGQTQDDDRMAKIFRKSGLAKKMLKALFLQVLGAAPGAVGNVTYKQVQGTTGDAYRSLRQIETTSINRSSTAADVLALEGMVSRLTAPASYPRDVSGNGGGGKVKF